MKSLTSWMLLVFTLLSCGVDVQFEEPQPADKANLNVIPKKLRGTYLSSVDSAVLTIDEQRMIERMDVEIRTLMDSLDIEIDSTILTDSTLNPIQLAEGKYNILVTLLPLDSVLVNFSYRDTVFEISDRALLRKYKGHYFLNNERGARDWQVRRLTLKRGELTFSKVSLPEEIAQLSEITEVEEIKADSGQVVAYKLNPSRKELKQLMKHSFSETATYRKLR